MPPQPDAGREEPRCRRNLTPAHRNRRENTLAERRPSRKPEKLRTLLELRTHLGMRGRPTRRGSHFAACSPTGESPSATTPHASVAVMNSVVAPLESAMRIADAFVEQVKIPPCARLRGCARAVATPCPVRRRRALAVPPRQGHGRACAPEQATRLRAWSPRAKARGTPRPPHENGPRIQKGKYGACGAAQIQIRFT